MANRNRSERTRLARQRLRAKLTQRELAEATGIPFRTYWRLETGRIDNPPIRHLMNCALVLGVDLADVCEPGWLGWTTLSALAPEPRSPEEIRRGRRGDWRRWPRS